MSQIEGYYKRAIPLVTARGFDYDIRGDTPPHLLAYKSLHDITGLAEVTEDEAGGKLAAMKHNQHVRKLQGENVLKTEQFEVALGQHRNLFAQAIIMSLSVRAPLRLDALKAKHMSKPGLYDGTAMWKELLELQRRVPK